MERTYVILSWIVMATLAVGIARQLSSQRGIYLLPDSWGIPFARHGQEGPLALQREGFENKKEEVVEGVLDETRKQEAGDPADAMKPSSYSILADVMPTKGSEGTLNANTCFQSDFLAQSEKTGNYIQRTNNIRHARPDSCSAPRTELVNAFYENVKI